MPIPGVRGEPGRDGADGVDGAPGQDDLPGDDGAPGWTESPGRRVRWDRPVPRDRKVSRAHSASRAAGRAGTARTGLPGQGPPEPDCPDRYSLQPPADDADALVCRRDGALQPDPSPSDEGRLLSLG